MKKIILITVFVLLGTLVNSAMAAKSKGGGGANSPKKKSVKPMGRFLVAGILATVVLAFVATPAVAAFITVNSLADNESSGNGFCTLREAMQNANNDAELSSGDCLGGADYDAIVFSTGPGTILIDSGLPRVTTEMAIIGPAAGLVVHRRHPRHRHSRRYFHDVDHCRRLDHWRQLLEYRGRRLR